jgi:hypothetical protein
VELRFLYVGSSDVEADLAAWLAAPGAELRWRFHAFGADVAAIDLGTSPLVLLADHRPEGSVLPIYEVDDLDAVPEGFEPEGGSMGTPEGPARLVRGPGGAEIALLRVDRPGAMDGAYADGANDHAVR